MPPILKRRLIFSGITFSLLLVVILSICCIQGSNRNRFQRFCNNLLTYEMSQNALNYHYVISDKSLYHSNTSVSTLPHYTSNNNADAVKSYELLSEQLDHISTNHLSNEDRYDYDLARQYLSLTLEGLSYPYMQRLFTSSGGVHSDLPILLAEYRINSVNDIEDYFSILTSCDEYFDGLCQYCEEQANTGIVITSQTAKAVIACCNKIMNRKEILDGNHFLISTFKERMNHLQQQNVITKEQNIDYCNRNVQIITEHVIPAYENLSVFMKEKTVYGSFDYGLSHYKNGRDYYLYLLRSMVGTSRSVEDIEQLLSSQFQKDYTDLMTSLSSHGTITAAQYKAFDNQFPVRSKEKILVTLYRQMDPDFPLLPAQSKENLPMHVSIKNVPRALEDFCAPAFYLIPPIDDYTQNTIYINKHSTLSGLSLYTTLAHEGFPGHLYQTLYQRKNVSHLRNFISYTGYCEGWAYYVEMMSYDFAAQEAKKTLPAAKTLYKEEQLNRSIQMCLLSMLDISVHYYGASAAQIKEVLNNFGIKDEQTVMGIYHYLVDKPAVYLTYYLGYLEILSLKEDAQSLWQNEYSDLKFHSFYLDYGACDFETLRSHLDDYVINQE